MHTPQPPTRTPLNRPLWPFFAAAAAIVVLFGSIAFARRGGPPDLKVSGPVTGTPTPTAERPEAGGSAATRGSFLGSGSWTMSSLPECFRERERLRGPLQALRASFPPPAARISPATVVRAGDCTIVVSKHELQIARGADRLRVPPEATLYREASGLTLVYVHGQSAEIRRY